MFRSDQIVGEIAGAGDEVVHRRRCPIVDGDPIALFSDIERKIGAHGPEADEADFRVVFAQGVCPPVLHRMLTSIIRCGPVSNGSCQDRLSKTDDRSRGV